jgi:hypothetical protein
MKLQYIAITALGMSLFGLTSCQDTLDTNPTSSFDESTVWSSKSTADAFVYGTYNAVITGIGWASGSCIDWESRTPNSARCCSYSEGIDNYATETSLSTSNDWGCNRFSVLRRCNLIIQKANESNFSDAEKAELIANARFLRGLIFFEQARRMGRFVPITQVFTEADSLNCNVPMTSTVAESYQYVLDDLQAGVDGLPTTASSGLPTKYAAEVILSRACLQAYAYTKDSSYLDKAISAATDVVNNKSLTSNYAGMVQETDGTNSEILWGYYRLASNSQVSNFNELIRTYPNIKAEHCTNSMSPIPLNNANGLTFEGWGIHWPTQDLVDQYLAIDSATGEALPWYETSQYKAAVNELDPSTITSAGQVDSYNRIDGSSRRIPTTTDLSQASSKAAVTQRYAVLKSDYDKSKGDISDIIYGNRDKRFAANIVYDKCTWMNETCEFNLAGNLSNGVSDQENGGVYNTTTNYCWRKMSIEDVSPRAFYNVKIDMYYILARVGEAYLNLAEAQLLKGNVSAAVNALNQTRVTHGGLPASTASTSDAAWADYIRERNCDMTNEGGDIYFSYLRWGKYGGAANHGRAAGDIIYDLDRPVYKIEINRDRTAFIINQLTAYGSANRAFTQRRYLFPISQSFLDTREAYGLDHVQNDLW